MWRRYTSWEKGENAVAVVSRYATRFDLLRPQGIRVAPVHYIDFQTERLRAIEMTQVLVGEVYRPFFHKDREFSDERELRAANIWPLPEGRHVAGQAPDFRLVRVDLTVLIDHIVLPPGPVQTSPNGRPRA
jgi:hypothetical protein